MGYQLIQLCYDFLFTEFLWITQIENIITLSLYGLVLYPSVKQTHHHINPSWVIIIAALSLTFEWIFFGGFNSTMPYNAFLLMMITVICCPKKWRLLSSSFFFVLILTLLYLDYAQTLPVYDTIIYPSKLTQVLDFLLHALLITIFTLILKQKFFLYRDGIVRKNKELKALDNELAEKNKALARQQAKIQLLNAKLEKMIEQEVESTKEKNRKLAEYAYINAHHLRGPLCRIMGLSDLMTESSPENTKLPRTIKRRAEELDVIIKQINHIIS
jgi:signal transduction histidine kinase